MSGAERRDYYRRTALRCLAAFVFWVMGVMLVAFMVTGAMFNPMGPRAMLISLIISVTGGLVLVARVLQLSRITIEKSLEREPPEQP
jgi:purine-cytosine permease-like protein